MAEILKGAPVAAAIDKSTAERVEALKAEGICPMLAIVRMGENPDDVYYEKSAIKRAEKLGIAVKSIVIPAKGTQQEAEDAVEACSRDEAVHGILMLRPLSRHIDENAVIAKMDVKKDIDGITPQSLAGVFMGGGRAGFAPCTPSACIRLMQHCGIELEGKNVALIGRSLVVGKPLAMLLLACNATVTVCHTRTRELADVCKHADIVIAAAGRARMVTADFVSPGQTVIDVGINTDEDGRLTGDVDLDSAEPIVGAITPVPGGVGTVTTSILMENVTIAAKGI